MKLEEYRRGGAEGRGNVENEAVMKEQELMNNYILWTSRLWICCCHKMTPPDHDLNWG